MARITLTVPFDPAMETSVGNNCMPPLRLALLAGACRSAGHETTVVDGVGIGYGHHWRWRPGFHLHGLEIDDLVARIPGDTEVLGVSMMFSQCYPPVRAFVTEVKRRRPELFLVMGGEGCTGIADLILRQAPVDAVVIGEGEGTLLDLIDAVEGESDVGEIPNVVTRTNGAAPAVDRRARNRFDDVDDIPPADWSGIPLETYWAGRMVHGVGVSERFLPMLATRGCPFKCKFCTAPGTWGRQRYPSVARAIADVREARDRHRVDYFIFNDLSMTTNIHWFEEFVDALIEADLGIRWGIPSGVRAQRLSRDLLERARRSGLVYLQISPETGSEKVMKWIEKAMDLDSIVDTVVNAKAVGLPVGSAWVIGHPVETWDDFVDTLRFVSLMARVEMDEMVISVFTPLPGSPVFEERRREQVVELDDAFFSSLFVADINAEVSHSPYFTGPELRLLRLYMYLWFFGLTFLRHPGRLVGALVRASRDEQARKMDRVLRYDFWRIVRGFAPVLHPASYPTLLKLLRHGVRRSLPGSATQAPAAG